MHSPVDTLQANICLRHFHNSTWRLVARPPPSSSSSSSRVKVGPALPTPASQNIGQTPVKHGSNDGQTDKLGAGRGGLKGDKSETKLRQS